MLDPDPGPCLLQTVLGNESVSPVLDKWNEPKVNRLRYLATVAGLVLMGLHDAAIGALIPYVRQSISRHGCLLSRSYATHYCLSSSSKQC